jgi:membrane-associated phospholipid phosphatase
MTNLDNASQGVTAMSQSLVTEVAASARPVTAPLQTRGRIPHGFFHLTMLGAALLCLFGSIIGLQLTHTSIRAESLLPIPLTLVLLLALARLFYLRRMPRAVNAITLLIWSNVFFRLTTALGFIAVRRQLPLGDDLLAKADAALGMSLPAVMQAMKSWPTVAQFLYLCYGQLMPLILLATVVPPLCGKMKAAKEYSVGALAAFLICLPVFATFEAIGPWVYYGYPPMTDQELYMQTFAAIRSHDWYSIDLSYSNGLITFPSFHTLLAILAATALWPISYVRWPAAILAVLIVISTVTTGTHYVTDVIAGLALTGVVRMVALGYSRLEARLTKLALQALCE